MASVKPDNKELQSFVDAIEESVKDLDWTLRCYSLTLRDLGLNEQQVVEKMREVFFQIVKGLYRDTTL